MVGSARHNFHLSQGKPPSVQSAVFQRKSISLHDLAFLCFQGNYTGHIKALVLGHSVAEFQRFLQPAAYYCKIIFIDAVPFANQPVKFFKCLCIFAEKNQPGGVSVQPVSRCGRKSPVDSRVVLAFFNKIIHHLISQVVLLLRAISMGQKAKWLFGSQYILILVSDNKLLFSLDLSRRLLQCTGILFTDVKRQLITCTEHGLCRHSLSIYLDILSNHLINVAQRRLIKIFFQKPVQPLASLVFVNYQLYHIFPFPTLTKLTKILYTKTPCEKSLNLLKYKCIIIGQACRA